MKLPFELDKKTINLIVYVVIGIVVLWLVTWTWNKLRRMTAETTRYNELITEANQEINVDLITLTPSQINIVVTKLYNAMKGWGTKEDEIYSAFEMIGSRSDLLQVIKVFGVKENETLSEWLYDDLSSSAITKINNILAAKNINYIF